jgi:hypothetical protein
MAKKHDLSDKNIPSVTCRYRSHKFSPLKARKLKEKLNLEFCSTNFTVEQI